MEKFRRFAAGVSSYDTEQSLLETLSGEFKGNAYTQTGTAFHNIVELGEAAFKYDTQGFVVSSDNVQVLMDKAQILEALNYRYDMAGAVYETPIGRDYNEGIFPIHVTGRVDVIHGSDVRDIKTKYSESHAEDYMDSYQWRLYLEILEADRFYFDVFEFKRYDKDRNGIDVRGLPLVRTIPVECLRYDDMERDNLMLIDNFREYIHSKNLYHLLKTKQ